MNAMGGLPGLLTTSTVIRLRRDGCTPLRFRGSLIGRHDGRVELVSLWHDLALYRTAAGGYAVAIVATLRVGGPDGHDSRPSRCTAFFADTLDAALTILETHDALRDVCPGLTAPSVTLDDPAQSPVALMLQAAALHCACQDIVRRYRIGVGAFLGSLGLQDV